MHPLLSRIKNLLLRQEIMKAIDQKASNGNLKEFAKYSIIKNDQKSMKRVLDKLSNAIIFRIRIKRTY